ncbi:MAG: tetratricopeptide repeat protein [Flavobacteriales bacterium]
MKNMKLLSTLYMVFLSCSLSAQDIEALKDSAELYYRQGKYELSAQKWEAMLRQNFHSSELYGALGNAYLRQNKFGLAILNYEKGVKMDPSDPDIQNNLELANSKKKDKNLSYISLSKETTTTRYDQLAWVAVAMVLIASGLLIASRFRAQEKRKDWLVAGWTVNTLAVGLIIFAGFKKNETEALHEAIILSPAVEIFSEPSSSSTKMITLHEGSKVLVLKSDGEWLLVKINEEFSGWIVKSSAVEI